MSASDFAWSLVFVAIGAGSALWFGWQLHPFWCRHRASEEKARRKLVRAQLDLIEARAEIRGLSALSAKEETAAPVEEYERFTRLAASFGCANPGSRGETCRDEYPDDADEWCLPCIAASILAPSSPQGPGAADNQKE